MIFVKSFFRKTRNKIYMAILIALCFILIFISSCRNYYNELLNNDYYEHTWTFLFTDNSFDSNLKEEKLIKDYKRVLSFLPGKNNDFITAEKISSNYFEVEEKDQGKFLWSYLTYLSENIILVFPASFFDEKIDNNEVILSTIGMADSNEMILGKDISFLYNGDYISLTVKKVIHPISNSFIMISDELFEELLSYSDNYIYYLKTYNYYDFKSLEKKFSLLDDEFFEFTYVIGHPTLEESRKNENLLKMIDYLDIISFLSYVIFIIIIVFTIRSLASDEIKNNLLLSQIGYNKRQIIRLNIVNFLILDFLVISVAILLDAFLFFTMNYIFEFNLTMFDLKYSFHLFIFIMGLEIFSSILYVKKV